MKTEALVQILVATFPAFFVIFISAFVVFRKPQQPNYLKRVEKKYSISPLNLR
jgi:hypothetical protein